MCERPLSPTIEWPEFGSDHNPHGVGGDYFWCVSRSTERCSRAEPLFSEYDACSEKEIFCRALSSARCLLSAIAWPVSFRRSDFVLVHRHVCGFHEQTRSQMRCGVGKILHA